MHLQQPQEVVKNALLTWTYLHVLYAEEIRINLLILKEHNISKSQTFVDCCYRLTTQTNLL